MDLDFQCMHLPQKFHPRAPGKNSSIKDPHHWPPLRKILEAPCYPVSGLLMGAPHTAEKGGVVAHLNRETPIPGRHGTQVRQPRALNTAAALGSYWNGFCARRVRRQSASRLLESDAVFPLCFIAPLQQIRLHSRDIFSCVVLAGYADTRPCHGAGIPLWRHPLWRHQGCNQLLYHSKTKNLPPPL